MATEITIDVSGIKELQNKLNNLSKKLISDIDAVLDANIFEIVTKAKQRAPVDIGGLRSAISGDTSKSLIKHITVNVFYSAYVEFGTGKYAAQYVATLPDNWQRYAAQFRGPTGETGFLARIQEWVRRKGIGTKKNYKTIGYLIFRKILLYGTHPNPFLLPSIEEQRPIILRDLENVLKNLGK